MPPYFCAIHLFSYFAPISLLPLSMNKIIWLSICVLSYAAAYAQNGQQQEADKGEFSGNFQTNNQFYQRDDRIGANTTQYLREKSSTEAWLFLNYKIKGFNFQFRYDVFNNSPLFNPQEAYSDQGIGLWQISKEIDKLHLTAGYFYDQFGSGMTFRAYEDRNIGIDFSIYGVKAEYLVSDDFRLKFFTGKQKFRFSLREPIIRGASIEKGFQLSENLKTETGVSVINRTIDQATMNAITSTINSYPLEERFVPKFNVYAFQLYNTLYYKNLSVTLEYNQKTPEAVMNISNRLISSGGDIYHASVSYSTSGFGLNAQYKRINRFLLRTSPLDIAPIPNNGPINYLPSITRQNTYRLLARYNAVVQELGENAAQLELTLKPNKKTQININTSGVVNLQGVKWDKAEVKWDTTTRLFRELYIDGLYKFSKSFKMLMGIQFIGYNQEIFEAKPNAPWVEVVTPFGEFTYRINEKRSVRFEWQWMNTDGDLGSFVNGLLEYNVAPHWSFSVGDLLNYSPGSINKPAAGEAFELIHYYNLFAAYTYKTTRFSAGYLKQPQGVNCTGGVCRVEPAFSGLRVGLTTNF
jgi:hypothetical protein